MNLTSWLGLIGLREIRGRLLLRRNLNRNSEMYFKKLKILILIMLPFLSCPVNL